jgi:hypothetical protein
MRGKKQKKNYPSRKNTKGKKEGAIILAKQSCFLNYQYKRYLFYKVDLFSKSYLLGGPDNDPKSKTGMESYCGIQRKE